LFRDFARIVLQQALYLHGSFGHTVDGSLRDAQCRQFIGNTDGGSQTVDEIDATPGGLFVCSGIIREKRDDVYAALTAAGYEILDERARGDWCAFAARKPEA
jgi:hypothetical protein